MTPHTETQPRETHTARVERMLTDLTHEITALRAITTRTETRLVTLIAHLGATHLIETKPSRPVTPSHTI